MCVYIQDYMAESASGCVHTHESTIENLMHVPLGNAACMRVNTGGNGNKQAWLCVSATNSCAGTYIATLGELDKM